MLEPTANLATIGESFEKNLFQTALSIEIS